MQSKTDVVWRVDKPTESDQIIPGHQLPNLPFLQLQLSLTSYSPHLRFSWWLGSTHGHLALWRLSITSRSAVLGREIAPVPVLPAFVLPMMNSIPSLSQRGRWARRFSPSNPTGPRLHEGTVIREGMTPVPLKVDTQGPSVISSCSQKCHLPHRTTLWAFAPGRPPDGMRRRIQGPWHDGGMAGWT